MLRKICFAAMSWVFFTSQAYAAVTVTQTVDKTSVCPGEIITVSTTITYSSSDDVTDGVCGMIDAGTIKSQMRNYSTPNVIVITTKIIAPSTPGTYTITSRAVNESNETQGDPANNTITVNSCS